MTSPLDLGRGVLGRRAGAIACAVTEPWDGYYTGDERGHSSSRAPREVLFHKYSSLKGSAPLGHRAAAGVGQRRHWLQAPV